MTSTMNQTFADTLRAALVDHVDRAAVARKRKWWRRAGGAGIFLVVVGGGAAAAQGVLPLPGADQVTNLSHPITVTRTGTSTVRLGPRPANATDAELRLRCLSAGTFTFADGASMSCSAADAAGGTSITTYAMALGPGQNSTTITTTRGARWTLTVSYSQHVPTGWATNARGQTYGVTNDKGEDPDLIAAIATNGKQGYLYAAELNGAAPANPAQAQEWSKQDSGRTHSIPVYASDGTTKIGSFEAPGVVHSGIPAPQPQQPSRSP
ncbi:hypothetical protein [Flexivirga alba]|uniref:Uncharacterized protein n=1 Tax=Flexivirga alba TaxID=702742 RepID=A0ABW2ABW5_9MICO